MKRITQLRGGGERQEKTAPVVDTDRGNIVADEEMFDYGGGANDTYTTHEEYVPPFVKASEVLRSGEVENDLEEGEIAPTDVYLLVNKAFYDYCLPRDEREIDDLLAIVDFKAELVESKKLRGKLWNQRRIRREIREAVLSRVGDDCDITRSLLKLPEIEDGNDNVEMRNILETFKTIYENLHDYHRMLNDIITSVSIGVIQNRGWLVNITFDMRGQSHRYKHVSSKLLINLALPVLFVIKNKVISTRKHENEVFRDMVIEWIRDIGLEVHNKLYVIKYFKEDIFKMSASRMKICQVAILEQLSAWHVN